MNQTQTINCFPYQYTIKQTQQQGKKNINIRITSQKINQQIIRKQSQLINKLKDDIKRLINHLREKDIIIQQLNKYINQKKYQQGNQIELKKKIQELTIEIQNINRIEEGKKQNGLENGKMRQIRKEEEEIKRINYQLIKDQIRVLKLKESQNSKLNNINMKKKSKQTRKTARQVEQIQIEQQTIELSQVQIQTEILTNQNELNGLMEQLKIDNENLRDQIRVLKLKESQNSKLNNINMKKKSKQTRKTARQVEQIQIEQQTIELSQVQIQTEILTNQNELNGLMEQLKIDNENLRDQIRVLKLKESQNSKLNNINMKKKSKQTRKTARQVEQIQIEQQTIELSQVQIQTEILTNQNELNGLMEQLKIDNENLRDQIRVLKLKESQNSKLNNINMKKKSKQTRKTARQVEQIQIEQQTIELSQVQIQTEILTNQNELNGLMEQLKIDNENLRDQIRVLKLKESQNSKLNNINMKKKSKQTRKTARQVEQIQIEQQTIELSQVQIQTEILTNQNELNGLMEQLKIDNENLRDQIRVLKLKESQNSKLNNINMKKKSKQTRKTARQVEQIQIEQQTIELSQVQIQTEILTNQNELNGLMEQLKIDNENLRDQIRVLKLKESQNSKLNNINMKKKSKQTRKTARQVEQIQIEQQTIELSQVQIQTEILTNQNELNGLMEQLKIDNENLRDQIRVLKLKESQNSKLNNINMKKKSKQTRKTARQVEQIQIEQQTIELSQVQIQTQPISSSDCLISFPCQLLDSRPKFITNERVGHITKRNSTNSIRSDIDSVDNSRIQQLTNLIQKLQSQNIGLHKDVQLLQNTLNSRVKSLNNLIFQDYKAKEQYNLSSNQLNNLSQIQRLIFKDNLPRQYQCGNIQSFQTRFQIIMKKLYEPINNSPSNAIEVSNILQLLQQYYLKLIKYLISKQQSTPRFATNNQNIQALPDPQENFNKYTKTERNMIKRPQEYQLNHQYIQFDLDHKLPLFFIQSEYHQSYDQIDNGQSQTYFGHYQPVFIVRQDVNIQNKISSEIDQIQKQFPRPFFFEYEQQQQYLQKKIFLKPFFIQNDNYIDQKNCNQQNIIIDYYSKLKPELLINIFQDIILNLQSQISNININKYISLDNFKKIIRLIGQQKIKKCFLQKI